MPLTYLSLCGMLGYGYEQAGLQRAMEGPVDFIGADNGSTDPGPYYLGSGSGFVNPMQIRHDLEPALLAARRARVPLIIGSAGGAGARPHVQCFLQILGEVTRQHGLHFRLAVIPADIAPDDVVRALRTGRIRPCGRSPEATEQDVRGCTHVVAQMGTAPIIRALDAGADVVVAGRCCDAAVFAAVPMWQGFDPGPALHAAKIAECGALCATPAGANDSLYVRLDEAGFAAEPVNPHRRCTPVTVAAHSLYEQPDPDGFHEPEGFVDLRRCTFEAVSRRAVRVIGSVLQPAARPAIKLEGASRCGHRVFTLAGVCDPTAIACIDQIEAGVRQAVAAYLGGTSATNDYRLMFRRYGLDAVTGRRADPARRPGEIGLVIEVVAPTRERASTVLSLARSTALHQPFAGRKTTAGNLAFPFSPSDCDGGEVYRFALYHLMDLEAGTETSLFPVHIEEV